jgi:hypothetical protein
MEILAKLFGNITKVKLMRFFLFNQDTAYQMSEIFIRMRSSKKEVRKEIQGLINVGLIKKKSTIREISIKKGKKVNTRKIQEQGYILDQRFPYLQALKNLLITVSLNTDDSIIKKFTGIGRMKLFIVSGVFIQEWDTRVDLLIVGDDLNFNRIDSVIKVIESEIGKEITYSAFETTDFEYRYGMHDRLIRDIMDLPHITLLNKLENIEK